MTAEETGPDTIIRKLADSDIAALVEMNNLAVPAVSELTECALRDLVAAALICLVAEHAGRPAGLLLCLKEGASAYKSPNYAWVSNALERFAYIDRIFVDEAVRGRNLGEALYGTLFASSEAHGRPFVCEVNSRPPNPGSLRFHKRLGFEEIGTLDHGDKAVVFLKRSASTGA